MREREAQHELHRGHAVEQVVDGGRGAPRHVGTLRAVPIDVNDFLAPHETAVITCEMQRGTIGDLAFVPGLPEARQRRHGCVDPRSADAAAGDPERQGEVLALLHHRYEDVGGYSARARAATERPPLAAKMPVISA